MSVEPQSAPPRVATVGPRPLHVLIPTHTPRYLDIVLAGLARQTRRADSITVSCDTDDPAIGSVIEACCAQFGIGASWVRRASHGGERLCQVRNNGVRHILESTGAASGRIVVLDGDMLASDGLLEQHERLGDGYDLVYAYRVNLKEAASLELDAERVFLGSQRITIGEPELRTLSARHRRYRRHLRLRRLRLVPLHKPKLLGGHFSVDLDLYERLNGFDELYQGWGFKDDEFARRAAKLGARVRVAVRDIVAWHLYHPTRQPEGPMRKLSTARRFARTDLPIVAQHGVRNPIEQPLVAVTRFGSPG